MPPLEPAKSIKVNSVYESEMGYMNLYNSPYEDPSWSTNTCALPFYPSDNEIASDGKYSDILYYGMLGGAVFIPPEGRSIIKMMYVKTQSALYMRSYPVEGGGVDIDSEWDMIIIPNDGSIDIKLNRDYDQDSNGSILGVNTTFTVVETNNSSNFMSLYIYQDYGDKS